MNSVRFCSNGVLIVVPLLMLGVLEAQAQSHFRDARFWSLFDPGAHGVGLRPDGYTGGVVAGDFVYFAPHRDDAGYHAEVLLLDRTRPFDDPGSWAAFDHTAHGGDPDAVGFGGVSFDGRYLYFIPYGNRREGRHGRVLRHDTQSGFELPAAWEVYPYAYE